MGDNDQYCVDYDHIDRSSRFVADRTDHDHNPNENLECLESVYRISIITYLLISAR